MADKDFFDWWEKHKKSDSQHCANCARHALEAWDVAVNGAPADTSLISDLERWKGEIQERAFYRLPLGIDKIKSDLDAIISKHKGG